VTFLHHFSGAAARGPLRRAVVATAVILCGVAGLAGCGKTISIGDAAPAAPAASSPPVPSSPPTAAAPGAGNTALQVVNSTAADAGLTGTGGTVVGTALQEAPPNWVQLSAVTSPQLSAPYLININQAALYRFDGDNDDPKHSHCNEACAAKWPPVTIKEGGNVYLAGVDSDEVGAIRREDGQVQITVGGVPVYRFAGDTKPGDLNGQGVGGTWFAVGPKGERITG
jgi:predicted lipoprotein with Yx(FWY)xxD motif